MYVIQFADGTYYQYRGGFDWGRCDSKKDATWFEDCVDEQLYLVIPKALPFQRVDETGKPYQFPKVEQFA